VYRDYKGWRDREREGERERERNIYIYTYIYVHMYVYKYTCIYIYTFICVPEAEEDVKGRRQGAFSSSFEKHALAVTPYPQMI